MIEILAEQASSVAPKVDFLHDVITIISIISTILVVGVMLYFAVRYRRRGETDHETPQITDNHFVEAVLTAITTIICIFVGFYGWVVFREIRDVPANALKVNVWAKQWKWDFEYENGKKRTGEAVIPVNQPVQFVMKSRDVLHSFFVPAMRVKADVIPNRYTYVTFTPVKTGDYHLFCTEYCGLDHSQMLGTIRVVPQAEYERWLSDRSEEVAMAGMSPKELGAKLYSEKGCNACHSLNGVAGLGPTFLKLFGKTETLTDESKVVVDENYLEESILYPTKKVVAGFNPVMPAFADQLKPEEVNALIAFIRAQDGTQAVEAPAVTSAPAVADVASLSPAERGKKIYETKLCIGCHSLDGTRTVGPTFKGVYGRTEKLTTGESITVDDAYIKRSLLEPNAQIVDTFAPAMPPYTGQLSDAEIGDIIEFLKTVK